LSQPRCYPRWHPGTRPWTLRFSARRTAMSWTWFFATEGDCGRLKSSYPPIHVLTIQDA